MYDTYLDEKILRIQNYTYGNTKKIKENAETSKKIKKNKNSFSSLYDELIILIRTFQILGFFPIGRDQSGRINTSAYSPLAIHCILIFIVISFASYLTLYDILKILQTNTMRFDDKVLHFAIITFMLIHFVPTMIFIERKKIAKYFESWDSFQAEFEKITGRPLIIKAKRKQIIIIIYLFITMPGFLYFLFKEAESRFLRFGLKKSWQRYSVVVSYSYYGFLTQGCTFLWYFCTDTLSQAAVSILNYFKECKNKKECPRDVSSLWLSLQELCCQLGKAYSYTFLFFLFYLFISVMLIGYSAITILGGDSGGVRGWVGLGIFSIGFLSLSVIPGLAHRATEKVVDDILNFVLRWATDEKNLAVVRELKWMAEYTAIKKQAISLGGFIVLNKSVNISMYGAMVTYFVVVLQFKTTDEPR